MAVKKDFSELSVRFHSTWQYYFWVRVDGIKKSFIKGGFDTEDEAREKGKKEWRKLIGNVDEFKPSTMSYRAFTEEWLTNVSVNLKASTIAGYKKKLKNNILPIIGDCSLSAITYQTLQEVINTNFERGVAFNSIRDIKALLTNTFRHAILYRYINYDPSTSLTMPNQNKKEEYHTRENPHKCFSSEELEKVFTYFENKNEMLYLGVLIGYKCGLRISECFGLTWDCIDWKNKIIKIEKQVYWQDRANDKAGYWYFTAPKYGEKRTVPISDDLYILLQEVKQKQDDYIAFCKRNKRSIKQYFKDSNDYLIEEESKALKPNRIKFVFIDEKTEYITSRYMQAALREAAKKLSISGLTFHSLRHTHATRLVESDAPLSFVRDNLGHKNIKTTWQYTHTTKEAYNAGVAKINQL